MTMSAGATSTSEPTATCLSGANETLVFIGGGNMAEAILGGLLSSGFAASQLIVCEPFAARSAYLREAFPGIIHSDDNRAAIRGGLPLPGEKGRTTRPADVVVLAVKPNVVRLVAEELAADVARSRTVVVSIAAGIRTCDLARWLNFDGDLKGYEPAIVRCMPNTPALVREGVTALYAMPTVSASQRDITANILGAVSETMWASEEDKLDAVTGLSGSGPAYFFLVLEALEEAGVNAGLSREVAQRLAVQTCKGAAKMASESPDSFAELRRKVTSPNGTTFAGLKVLIDGGLTRIFSDAVNAAADRSREMGIGYGDS